MISYNCLSGPCFDLNWIRTKPLKDSISYCLLLLPIGGGNKTKSGIKNQIHIMKYIGKNGCELITKIDTDDLCYSINSGIIEGNTFFCGSYTEKCVVYSIELNDENQLCSNVITEFAKEELSIPEMSMNVILFFKEYIITGGENGVCYVWSMKRSNSTWEVTKVKELKEHNGPIKSLVSHPTKDWFLSTSDDGTCQIWDVNSLKSIGLIKCTAGLPGITAIPSKKTSTVKCRGAIFSVVRNTLFTVQCGTVGSSHLIEWSMNETTNDSVTKLSFEPLSVIKVSDVPACRLVGQSKYDIIDSNDPVEPIFCYGDCDGSISIYSMKTLKLITKNKCHEFPVTGLGIAPKILLTNSEIDLSVQNIVSSCSADNTLTTILVKEPKNRLLQFIIFLLILLTIFVFFLIFMKFKQNNDIQVG